MQRCFTFGSTVTHEATRLDAGFRRAIWIVAARQEHLENEVVGRAVRFAHGRMERRLAGVGIRVIHVRAVLDHELAQLPMPVKCSGVEAEIWTKRSERLAMSEQEPYRAHVAVVGAPVNERRAATICGF